MIRIAIFTILCLSIPTNIIAGVTFTDRFPRRNDRWIEENNNLFCIGHQCFYAKKENLQYNSIADDLPHQTYVEITLRNNCIGPKCCYMDVCTKYIGGQITSRPLYNYGSYRFLALVEGNVHEE